MEVDKTITVTATDQQWARWRAVVGIEPDLGASSPELPTSTRRGSGPGLSWRGAWRRTAGCEGHVHGARHGCAVHPLEASSGSLRPCLGRIMARGSRGRALRRPQAGRKACSPGLWSKGRFCVCLEDGSKPELRAGSPARSGSSTARQRGRSRMAQRIPTPLPISRHGGSWRRSGTPGTTALWPQSWRRFSCAASFRTRPHHRPPPAGKRLTIWRGALMGRARFSSGSGRSQPSVTCLY